MIFYFAVVSFLTLILEKSEEVWVASFLASEIFTDFFAASFWNVPLNRLPEALASGLASLVVVAFRLLLKSPEGLDGVSLAAWGLLILENKPPACSSVFLIPNEVFLVSAVFEAKFLLLELLLLLKSPFPAPTLAVDSLVFSSTLSLTKLFFTTS